LDNLSSSKDNNLTSSSLTAQHESIEDVEQQSTLVINGMTLLGANRILNNDQAMEMYSYNANRTFCLQSIYQNIAFVIVTLSIVAESPIHNGL
jgi:hypothetical protein